jgi:hypothetical protein
MRSVAIVLALLVVLATVVPAGAAPEGRSEAPAGRAEAPAGQIT